MANNKGKRSTAPKKQQEQIENVKKGVIANCAKVRFRKSPEAESLSNVIDILDSGKGVVILESDSEWTKVKVGKFEGYIMSQYIEVK